MMTVDAAPLPPPRSALPPHPRVPLYHHLRLPSPNDMLVADGVVDNGVVDNGVVVDGVAARYAVLPPSADVLGDIELPLPQGLLVRAAPDSALFAFALPPRAAAPAAPAAPPSPWSAAPAALDAAMRAWLRGEEAPSPVVADGGGGANGAPPSPRIHNRARPRHPEADDDDVRVAVRLLDMDAVAPQQLPPRGAAMVAERLAAEAAFWASLGRIADFA
jgi:hypothetical protein